MLETRLTRESERRTWGELGGETDAHQRRLSGALACGTEQGAPDVFTIPALPSSGGLKL